MEGLIGNATAKEAAQKSGISASNFTRWKQGANADPEFVVKIARAYDANVLEALVEAEFITADEAGSKPASGDLVDVVRTLSPELLRVRSMADALEKLLEKLEYSSAKIDHFETEFYLKTLSSPAEQECSNDSNRKLRAVPTDEYYDGTVQEWTEQPHAAYSGKNETEARLERGEDPID